MATRKKIEQIANALLGNNPALPVDVDEIIKKQGIRLVPYEEPGISGILMIERSKATIGYSEHENAKRQRFTKAHELGHFMLHRGGDLFIDKGFNIMHRPSTNTPSSTWQEWEANEFAACLLMPEELVKEEMRKLKVDYEAEEWLVHLAKKFDVSLTAMSIRISRLGLD